jgi:uncharacterized cupin superfamily protein
MFTQHHDEGELMSQDTTVAAEKPTFLTADSGDGGWGPFMLGDEAVGEWKPVRADADGSYLVGFWRNLDGQKGAFDFPVETNKTVYVISGRVRLTINSSEVIEVGAGESVALHSCATHWEVIERPYLDMFVIG